MQGPGADTFAEEVGLEKVDAGYVATENQRSALEAMLGGGDYPGRSRIDTVGAVARDRRGGLAAGVSTGSLTGKRPGRMGDSAVLGAGVYADDRACAVSCTGDGEVFLRLIAAHEVATLVLHAGLPLAEAAGQVVALTSEAGAEGGLIALGPVGEPVFPYHSKGMYREVVASDGSTRTAIDETREAPAGGGGGPSHD